MLDTFTANHLDQWLDNMFIDDAQRLAAKTAILTILVDYPEWIDPPEGQESQSKSWGDILSASDFQY